MIDRISGSQSFQNSGSLKKAEVKSEASEPQAPLDSASINQSDEKEWTVLYYFDGKNNLASMAKSSFSSVQQVGSDENVNVLAELAVGKNDVLRGKVTNEKTKEVFPGAENIGQADMGSAEHLKQFVEWGMKNYPAKHYALVLWDHGAGFKGSMTDDETKHLITNKQLADSLKEVEKDTGNKMDLINFNACLMGQAEVAYELRDTAKFLVGSEEVEAGLRIPIPGLFGTTPQHKTLTDLQQGIKERGEIKPEELAKLYVFESEKQFGQTMFTPTQSAIDLSKMEGLKNSANNVAEQLLNEIKKDPKAIEIVRKDINNTQHFLNYDMFAEPYNDYRDLGDFAKTLMNEEYFKGTGVHDAAAKLLQSVKEAVIAEQHASESFSGQIMEGATGISTYLPKNYGFDAKGNSTLDGVPVGGTHGYENTSYAKDTKWDELLDTIKKDNEIISKYAGKHPKITKFIETALMLASGEGYQQAYAAAIHHATSPIGGVIPLMEFPYILPLPGVAAAGLGAVGGALKTSKGVEKVVAGATKEFAPGKNAKLTVNGLLDVVAGVGSIVTCGALLAGAGAVAFPAGAVVLGLGLGRALVSLGSGLYKSHQASKMTVSEKLESMEKKLQE